MSCDNWNDQRKAQAKEQRANLLNGLTKWFKPGRVIDKLKTAKDRDAWNLLEGHDRWILRIWVKG